MRFGGVFENPFFSNKRLGPQMVHFSNSYFDYWNIGYLLHKTRITYASPSKRQATIFDLEGLRMFGQKMFAFLGGCFGGNNRVLNSILSRAATFVPNERQNAVIQMIVVTLVRRLCLEWSNLAHDRPQKYAGQPCRSALY